MSRKKNILITGAGFIFSNFAEMFFKDYNITFIDDLGYASQAHRASRWSNIYEGDCANYDRVLDVFKTCDPLDAVIIGHAQSHVDNSNVNPRPFIDSNVTGVFNVLEACKAFSIGRTILISTDEVLSHRAPIERLDGSLEWSFSRLHEGYKVHEPSSVYSATKAAGEMLAYAYRTTHKLPIDIIRLTNQYGPHQHPEKMAPKTIKNALEDKPIPLYKTPAWRDWCYVEDGCRGIQTILEKGERGGDWHISAYNETLTSDVVKLILKKMGKPESLIQEVADRPGYDLYYSLGSEKLRAMGWEPQVSLSEGLDACIKQATE